MSWHEHVALEIVVEFRRLSEMHWLKYEERLWWKARAKDSAWMSHGKWWLKTTTGKQYHREHAARHHRLLSATPAGYRKCRWCGNQFELNMRQALRSRAKSCSRRCPVLLAKLAAGSRAAGVASQVKQRAKS